MNKIHLSFAATALLAAAACSSTSEQSAIGTSSWGAGGYGDPTGSSWDSGWGDQPAAADGACTFDPFACNPIFADAAGPMGDAGAADAGPTTSDDASALVDDASTSDDAAGVIDDDAGAIGDDAGAIDGDAGVADAGRTCRRGRRHRDGGCR